MLILILMFIISYRVKKVNIKFFRAPFFEKKGGSS